MNRELQIERELTAELARKEVAQAIRAEEAAREIERLRIAIKKANLILLQQKHYSQADNEAMGVLRDALNLTQQG